MYADMPLTAKKGLGEFNGREFTAVLIEALRSVTASSAIFSRTLHAYFTRCGLEDFEFTLGKNFAVSIGEGGVMIFSIMLHSNFRNDCRIFSSGICKMI